MKTGVLADYDIKSMIDLGQIESKERIQPAHIQPASLDLRLGDVAYRVPASVLPGKNEKINDLLNSFSMHATPIDDGAVLEKNCVYIVPLLESLALPPDVNAIANAKSTTGRLDVFTRLITDHGVEFDRVPSGYTGPLYAEICPRSFSVLIRKGQRLNQIRFRRGRVSLDDRALRALHSQSALVNHEPYIEDGLGFSVDLSPELGDVIGYRAKPHTPLIDLDLINHYRVDDFWEPVYAQNQRIILDPGAFYILASREEVRVPPQYACEMAPYVAMVGEFRVHYAGFFDPGFGMNDGGARGVLEVRCHEAPFVLNHGQRVGRLVYEKMANEPQTLYGTDIGSNYQGQGLKLAKQFRMD